MLSFSSTTLLLLSNIALFNSIVPKMETGSCDWLPGVMGGSTGRELFGLFFLFGAFGAADDKPEVFVAFGLVEPLLVTLLYFLGDGLSPPPPNGRAADGGRDLRCCNAKKEEFCRCGVVGVGGTR